MRVVVPTLLAGLVLGCSPTQYIGIPGATWLESAPDEGSTVSGTPTVVVLEGNPDLVVGESVTVSVEFSTVTDIVVTEFLLVFAYSEAMFWELPLTEEDSAAGVAEFEVFALDEEPAVDIWCPRNDKGQMIGTCYQEAPSGTTGGVLFAASEASSSEPVLLPITLAPLAEDDPGGECQYEDLDDCCFTSGGVQAVGCYVVSPCQCPEGTGYGGDQGNGTELCACPGA
ncbi:MAG: hypothetical protein Q8P41_14085 [Pseudomonadota bacterium]|nr:hypothetical protein [Pseudomonadota bacterium]